MMFISFLEVDLVFLTRGKLELKTLDLSSVRTNRKIFENVYF